MLLSALMRAERRTIWMRQQGQKTRYPGVYKVGNNEYRVRAVGRDPRTGKRKAVEKLFEGSAQEAARMRSALLEEIQASTRVVERQRVGEFAQSWIKSKAVSLDPGTARTYAEALDRHVLPALGAYCAKVGHDDDQDLLRRILGVCRMAEHAQREPVHRVLHRLDHGAHRTAVAGRRGAHLRHQVVACIGIRHVGLETSAAGFVTAALATKRGCCWRRPHGPPRI
jgi:hypothetical protein